MNIIFPCSLRYQTSRNSRTNWCPTRGSCKSEPVHEPNITSSGLDHTFRPICVTSSNRENRAHIHRCHWHRAERWLSSSTKEWFERTVSMVMPCIRHISAIGCAMHSRNTWIVCARRSLLRQCAHLERRISRDQTAALLDHRTLLLHFICSFVSGFFPPVKYNVALRSWQAACRIVLFGGFTQFGGGASSKGNRWWVYDLVHVSSHNTHNSATVAMHLSIKSRRPSFDALIHSCWTEYKMSPLRNKGIVMCR